MAEKVYLATVEDAQEKADAAQAAAVQRANHTGTQAISTVSGLQDALDGKADLDGGGRVAEAQLPTHLAESELKATLVVVSDDAPDAAGLWVKP